MQIDNHVFLITGGASGLGEGTAELLARRGAKLVIADLDRKRGQALVNRLGSNARFVEMDVADEAAGRAAVSMAVSAFGALHGLINAAGAVHGEQIIGKQGTHTLTSFRRMLEVNLVGTFSMICAAAETISQQPTSASGERGVIVNTASVAAFDGQIGQAAYSASKAGVTGMTLPLARDLASIGIRVVTIAPGIFDTPLLETTLKPFLPNTAPTGHSSGVPQSIKDEIGRMVPFPSRLGRADEFASLAAQIIENEMLNGEVIRLDGGVRMQPK